MSLLGKVSHRLRDLKLVVIGNPYRYPLGFLREGILDLVSQGHSSRSVVIRENPQPELLRRGYTFCDSPLDYKDP